MLKEYVRNELKLLELNGLQNSLFYKCKYGIRFEIGVGYEPHADITQQKEYIEHALNRVRTIYKKGIKSPGVLVWKIYPQSEESKINLLNYFSRKIVAVFPHEEVINLIDREDEHLKETYLYWDLKKVPIPMDVLFREIILGDLGGVLAFTSSVYIVDVKNHVILSLYDDRGLDIVAYKKHTLSPLYKNLNEWILDYDRKEIDKVFLN